MNRELTICEVGPRDGLQSAAQVLTAEQRVNFVAGLVTCGLTKVEVGSLVNPKLVPTMADSDQVYLQLAQKLPQHCADFSLLVPNEKGLNRALEIGCQSVAFFTATSETFNRKNINRGVAESIADLNPLIARAKAGGMLVRLYLSTVFDCAYEGTKTPEKDLVPFLPFFDQVDEISLGDTTGRATQQQVADLIGHDLLKPWHHKIWWHFHDTYQLAEANTRYCMQQGFNLFDSSAGGIGGCPFSPGAKGNIATEKVLRIADEIGLKHSVQLPLALPV
ncbi:MAG: hydroxymethylglutaryl-CoA lyase [Spirochaetota bacterium]